MDLMPLKVVVLLSVLGHCLSQKGDCYYYFVRQPSLGASCNPWPLLNNTTTLPLHCHILAPKNDHLPNVKWYKNGLVDEGTIMRVYPGGPDPKYSNPVSSGDLIDFKFVNFSLIIHNVSNSDMGCYWCEISVNDGEKCAFNIQPSSQFCLLEGDQYNTGTSNCHSFPMNEEMVCVANTICGSTVQTSISSSELMESGQTLSTSSSSETVFTSTKQSMIDTNQVETNTVAVESTPVSLFSNTPLSQQNSFVLNSGPMMNSVSNGMHLSSQPLNVVPIGSMQSTKTPLSQQELRVGLYVGVGVCCLLLVVILVLLAAVVVLCKVPRAKKREKESVVASNISSQPLNNAVWSKSNSGSAAMSVINESSIHLITDSSISLTQLSPLSQSITARPKQECTGVVASASGHSDSLSSLTIATSMEQREAVIKGVCEHHRLSLTDEFDEQHHNDIGAHSNERSDSPDSHYYHVLECPGYSDAEGREFLLRNWKEGDTSTAKSQSSYGTPNTDVELTNQITLPCMIEVEDKDGYHWRIVPPTGKKEGSSSPQKRKHQYTKLDSTKMEPRREYARVSVKRIASPEFLEREQ